MSKRIPKTKFPNGATKTYERFLLRCLDRVGKQSLKLFNELVAQNLKADSINYREDVLLKGLSRMFKNLKQRITYIFTEKSIETAARGFVTSVARSHRRSFERQAKVQGINLVAAEPWLKDFLNERVRNNVSYIKNLEEEAYERIENIMRQHIELGSSNKVIRDAIMQQVDISKSRAQFLAVDQAGSILGQITAERHERLGIEKFIWDTSGDERVRDTHRELDGIVFSYDDPPTVNGRKVLPGEDYRCRCVAIPVFEDV